MAVYEVSGLTKLHYYAFTAKAIRKEVGTKKRDGRTNGYKLINYNPETYTLTFETDTPFNVDRLRASLATCDRGLVLKVL